MSASNPNERSPSDSSEHILPINRLAGRFPDFKPHTESARQRLSPKSMRRKLGLGYVSDAANRVGAGRWDRRGIDRQSPVRAPLSAEDLRIHARLTERLQALHYERYGLWPKLRRFLFGN